MSWVLQKANFDCRAFSLWARPEPDVSSYKSKYDDIDWIVDTRTRPLLTALQSSQFLREMFSLDDKLSCFRLNLLMLRIRGLASSYSVDQPVPNLLDSPER